jgi:uncharacterized protein
MATIYDNIFDYVLSLEIIDTHEHLPPREDLRDKHTDVLKEYLHHYFSSDIRSAGLKLKDYKSVVDVNKPLLERWEIVSPFWEAARNTGFGRALDITVKELYGIDKITGGTIEHLNQEFLKTLKPGHFHKVLKEKSRIKISLLDVAPVDYAEDVEWDQEFFRKVCRMDKFVNPESISQIEKIGEDAGFTICSINDYISACEITLDKALAGGAVALKNGLAYTRSLSFERVPFQEAEMEFNRMLKSKRNPEWWWNNGLFPNKKFQDYMQHIILNLANKRNLTYCFHTGLHEGTGNLIQESNPVLLSNLFLEYPDITFDLFHIGYPYQLELSALAKTFPNVMIDMCWAHIISPTACINALIEWLDSVPANKISAFGGDYCLVDGVYGHQYMARENVSRALAHKVKRDVFNIERAKEIAKMLFYDNPYRIFNLHGKL